MMLFCNLFISLLVSIIIIEHFSFSPQKIMSYKKVQEGKGGKSKGEQVGGGGGGGGVWGLFWF